jgi:putative ABC transport system permease protein
MRDFKAFVRSEVSRLGLPPQREQKIVDEWGDQLEEIYLGLRADGRSDHEAWRELQHQVPDWHALSAELLDTEPVLLRLAPPSEGHIASGLVRDIRDGLRQFVKAPGFCATVVLTLGVCLGANAAIFTVVHAVLLRPLPVPQSDRIVGMGDVYPTITPNDILSNDVPSYFDRRTALSTLEEQAMFTFWYDTLTIEGIPQEIRGMRVTPSLFRVLRVEPAAGRTFTDDEGEVGNDQKIVISHGLWQQLYGGNPNALGQTLRLGWTGKVYTVVGVMPPDFSFFDRGYEGHAGDSRGVQFWIPLTFTAAQKSDDGRTRYGYFHIGRLRPEASVEQVQAQLDALHAETVRRFPQFDYERLGMYTAATPLQEALTRPVRRTLHLLWAGAGFVLLIGAINVANLVLVRSSRRQRELATRVALGAAPAQVARQLLIESMMPALAGGIVGVAVGAGILQWLTAAGLEHLPNASGVRLGGTTVAFVLALSAAVGLIVGVVPASASRPRSLGAVLSDGSRSISGGRKSRLLRRALVVAQVAVSVVLLVSATLLFTSLRHLLGIDAGFQPSGVVTATIFPPPSRYPNPPTVVALQDRVLERVRAIPGVDAAGITSNIALSGFESPSTVSRERAEPSEATVVPSIVAVTPGYFEAMSTPLVRGRYFSDADRADTSAVAMVDQSLARRLWPGGDPIGRDIYRGGSGPFTVVGLVRDVRLESLAGSIDPIGTAYFPHSQTPPLRRLRWIAIKSAVEPAVMVRSLRAALLEIDPLLPISDVQTMSDRVALSLVSQRLAASLATMFAFVALFLSMLGLYGVLAHLVAGRTRELGIRLALGSTVGGVFRLVLAEGLLLVGAGLGLGVAGAIAAASALKGQVFGVQATDPLLLIGVALATSCIALVACIAPARRATRVNPVQVLSGQ